MYKVKVVGEYIARSGVMQKEKVKKSYEVEGNIPTLVAALSIVKNKLLNPALSKKYNDYVTYLTYHIIAVEPLTEASKEAMNKSEISFMDREALVKYIRDHALPIDVGYYPNLFRLREAVQFAREDPKGYEKHFSLREADLRLDIEMAKCNPELFDKPEGKGFIGTVEPGVLKSKAGRAAKPEVHAKNTGDRLKGLQADQERDGEMGPMDSAPEAGDL